MNWPKISIVTPSYNQVRFLEATIQSIITQEYPNLEYIIIDGGSTDGSVEIIKKYEKHLHYWCSEPDEGQYDAINKGFNHSSGEIMAWLNSDDMYFPWTLKTAASIISTLPEVEWLTTLNQGAWDWNGFLTRIRTVPGYSKEALLDGVNSPWMKGRRGLKFWLQQESMFWTRSLWRKVGGFVNKEIKMAADFELWTRFFQHVEIYATSSPLAGFRFQDHQKTYNIQRYVEEANSVLQNLRDFEKWYPGKSRSRLASLRFLDASKIGKKLISVMGYKGKRVVRLNEKSRDGHWGVEDYRFLW